MKVLTATRETQGWRDNDFSWTVEGELVFFVPIECGRGSIDDGCGCRRGMAGMVSHLATTTVKVVDREDLNPRTYFALVQDALHSQGYLNDDILTSAEVREWVEDQALELRHMASAFPIGTILERRGDMLSVRKRL